MTPFELQHELPKAMAPLQNGCFPQWLGGGHVGNIELYQGFTMNVPLKHQKRVITKIH